MQKILKIWIILWIIISLSTQAIFSARLYFEDTQVNIIKNCTNQIDIMLDTEGKPVSTLDLQLFQWEFEIIEISSQNSPFNIKKKIQESKARHIDFKDQKTRYSLLATDNPKWFNWTTKVATLLFKPNIQKDTISLKFYAIDNYKGDDSNALTYKDGKIYDLLNESTDIKLKIKEWECPHINNIDHNKIKIEDHNIFINKWYSKIENQIKQTFDIIPEQKWIKINININNQENTQSENKFKHRIQQQREKIKALFK